MLPWRESRKRWFTVVTPGFLRQHCVTHLIHNRHYEPSCCGREVALLSCDEVSVSGRLRPEWFGNTRADAPFCLVAAPLLCAEAIV